MLVLYQIGVTSASLSLNFLWIELDMHDAVWYVSSNQ